MAASELFNRYIWLVDLIFSSGGITREEISSRWSRSSLNYNNEPEIPERTFHRHKDAIKELFDIDIVCDRSAGKVYKIANSDDIRKGGVRTWLINTFAVNNLINESHQIKQRILFEQIPSGQRFLTPIIEAMRDNHTLTVTYQSFHRDRPSTFEVEPYCVKVFKQRWYLLARSAYNGDIRIYGLDRILSIEQNDNTFNLPKGFDAESYFDDVIGIIIGSDDKLETIEIEVSNGQQNYFRSLPLHHTQQETSKGEYSSTFTFFLRPTFDFIQELLRYGSDVEVIRPLELRKQFAKIAKDMNELYSDDGSKKVL